MTEPPPRTVYVKGTHGIHEVGIGSVEARLIWEGQTDEYGAFPHLALTPAGDWYVSITDMEEHDGSYMSVPVTSEDLRILRDILAHLDALGALTTSQAIDARTASAEE